MSGFFGFFFFIRTYERTLKTYDSTLNKRAMMTLDSSPDSNCLGEVA